jgi:16S rRNA processing protein RimM
MTQTGVLPKDGSRWIRVGAVRGSVGLAGELRVESLSDDPAWILQFEHWWLGDPDTRLDKRRFLGGRKHGRGVAVQLEGVANREAARELFGTSIWVQRSHLPEADDPEAYYWTDLVGCRVMTETGESLGEVDHVFATGSNDVLAVRTPEGKERLLPYIDEVVRRVDLEQGVLIVHLMPGL